MPIVGFTCSWTFYSAYKEGTEPLLKQTPASELEGSGERRIELTPAICRRLENQGYLVIDNFLTPVEVDDALTSIKSLKFHPSQNEKDGNQVRNDTVSFHSKTDDQCNVVRNHDGVSHIHNIFHRLSYDINNSSFNGFDNEDEENYKKSWLGVPSTMQVAMYDSIKKNEDESQKADEEGAYYEAHYDACSDDFSSLGVIGWLKSLYLRKRYITCIIYLNPNWVCEDGGRLRMFQPTTDEYIDIEPKAGRLVLFSSVKMMHAVLPSFSKRLACTVWFTINK